jgi:hypothetical protein
LTELILLISAEYIFTGIVYLICVLFIDIIGVACLVAGFTATDTAKVGAERANLALRILPESSSRIISMSYTDFFSLTSLLRVSFF